MAKIVVLDFETFYSNEYTLSRMTTEEYVRDNRFEALCVSVVSEGKGVAVPQEHLKAFFASYDWSDKAVVMHHAQFDGLILNHHFNIRPKFMFDTISMARTAYGPHQRLSLAKLLEKFGMAPKTIDYNEFKGKRWHEMGDRTKKMLMNGAVHDSVQTERLFKMMLPLVPVHELALIDRTVRCFTEPQVEGDIEAIRKICYTEVNRKEEMLHELNVKKADLSSAAIFQRLLETEGVEVIYKQTKTIDKNTGEFKEAPAFAKTDEFMQDLQDSENPRVRALVEARLGVKSTLNETRSGRMLRMAERGSMCIYLHHAGTHTLRCSGGDKMNWLNMPRTGELRKSLCAQEGKKLSIVDGSQFELRLALWLAGQTDKLDKLARGEDIYSEMASIMFERPITKADELERYAGKQIVLQSQYGAGKDKQHRELNFKHGVPTTIEAAEHYINSYRSEYNKVAAIWKEVNELIPFIANGDEFKWKCFFFKGCKMYAPNGSFMFFDHLEKRPDKKTGRMQWYMEKRPGKWEKIYGAKMFENFVQFLQRTIAADMLLKIPAKYPLVLWPYDELVHSVPENEVEDVHKMVMKVMSTSPDWAPDLPLAAEGKISDRYSK